MQGLLRLKSKEKKNISDVNMRLTYHQRTKRSISTPESSEFGIFLFKKSSRNQKWSNGTSQNGLTIVANFM